MEDSVLGLSGGQKCCIAGTSRILSSLILLPAAPERLSTQIP